MGTSCQGAGGVRTGWSGVAVDVVAVDVVVVDVVVVDVVGVAGESGIASPFDMGGVTK